MINKSPSIHVLKSAGNKSRFSIGKLKSSLRKSGASEELIQKIVNKVRDELYQGIPTKEIYKRSFEMLKKSQPAVASRYKLKKAIYELGPTGFPFERFIGALLYSSGYTVDISKKLQGKCVTHEVDVIAKKGKIHIVGECKFHSEEGRNCDVKIPLYIQSRYKDIKDHYLESNFKELQPNEGWVITNTRFTKDAQQYGKCVGLYLLSWDYPKGNSLKERIDRLFLYPITVSTLMSKHEKQLLLNKDIVLCKQLIEDESALSEIAISEKRKSRILKEMRQLCNL